MDLVADLGLEQIVHEPTHEGSTFDLVLTKRPDLVPRVETVPRMSDHEIVYFECITCSPKKINNPRPIPLYDKANWSAIREDMSVLHEKMSTMEQEQDTPVEEMWQLLSGSSLWKSTSPQDCLEKVINPLDLSGAMPFDQKTRSEVLPDKEAGHRQTEG